eukprot:GHVO01043746.1.p1 GENE.GHVO01043746.1~~GHVO01043746.1.p1  ORF type:complete len:340 (+),score=35.16 GHVO01043746.1:163-1182(+)
MYLSFIWYWKVIDVLFSRGSKCLSPNHMAPRILSVQSHVIRDNVGNKVAVFPMQLLGYDVDVVNTVQFSSMYIHEGSTETGQSGRVLFRGLLKAMAKPRGSGHPGMPVDDAVIDNDVTSDYSGIVSGYVATGDCLDAFVEFLEKLRSSKANDFVYLCDPVLGDNGKLYVSPELVDVYRKKAVPLADIITPNHHELNWLTGHTDEPTCMDDVFSRCEDLHKIGVKIVIVTSAKIGADNSTYHMVCSEKQSNISAKSRRFSIPFERQDVFMGGPGDLMASLILGYFLKSRDVRRACEVSMSILQDVMKSTVENDPTAPTIDIIGARDLILKPNSTYEATFY